MSSTYGYSPRILPFAPDSSTGFSQNMTLQQVAVQNFMNIVLCCPGERIMYADFGVGLRNYLFQMNDSRTRQKIKNSILNQTATYLPYIKIRSFTFTGTEVDANLLKINIFFEILSTKEIVGMAFAAASGGSSWSVSYGIDPDPSQLSFSAGIAASDDMEATVTPSALVVADGHTAGWKYRS